jgi:hypothetical protein
MPEPIAPLPTMAIMLDGCNRLAISVLTKKLMLAPLIQRMPAARSFEFHRALGEAAMELS